jgi:hypothetical protein
VSTGSTTGLHFTFTSHHKNLHMAMKGHQMRRNIGKILLLSVYLSKNFHMMKLPVF